MVAILMISFSSYRRNSLRTSLKTPGTCPEKAPRRFSCDDEGAKFSKISRIQNPSLEYVPGLLAPVDERMEEVKVMFEKYDADDSKKLSLEQFVNLMSESYL